MLNDGFTIIIAIIVFMTKSNSAYVCYDCENFGCQKVGLANTVNLLATINMSRVVILIAASNTTTATANMRVSLQIAS